MFNMRKMVFVILLLMASLTAGCANNNFSTQGDPLDAAKTIPEKSVSTETATSVSPPLGQETMQVTIYHATNDAMYLVPEIHVIPQNDHPAQTAIELLLSGTKNPALLSLIPPDTKLKNIWVKDHIAYVDFNDKFIKNKTGGSTAELLLVGSIVDTLTEFPNIQKVQLLAEGKKIDTIFGHMDTGEPLGRLEKLIKKI
jgi:germination protein M